MPLFLEELRVGDSFSSGPHQVDAEQIRRFAGEFDPQPFHLDEEAARGSIFGELVASGWHTGAMDMRLLVEALPIASGLVGAGAELAWLRPVRPGDSLRLQVTIVSSRQSATRPGLGLVQIRCETLNQKDEPVMTMTASILVPCRGSEAA